MTARTHDHAETIIIPTPCGLVELRQVLPGRWEPVAVLRCRPAGRRDQRGTRRDPDGARVLG